MCVCISKGIMPLWYHVVRGWCGGDGDNFLGGAWGWGLVWEGNHPHRAWLFYTPN